jgi:hypothetical protein
LGENYCAKWVNFERSSTVSRLKKPNGAAYYLLPTQNPEDVSSVLIWCKQFKEYIGSADFKPAK